MPMHASKIFPRRAAAALTAVLLLSACGSLNEIFTTDAKQPLQGQRISVLQLQNQLVPNPELQDASIRLPEVWDNKFWPQNGGYPNHALGHLALGRELKEVWSSSIGSGASRRAPLVSTPVVAEDSVFTLDTAGNVTAFELATGKKKWRESVVPLSEEDNGAVGGGIAYAAGKVFATSGYKYLAAHNPATGKLIWKADLPSPARGAPTVMEDHVYLVTLDNRLVVYSAADGTPIWNYSGVSETTNILGSASPAVDETIVVLPLSSGEIYGLRPENGQVVWQDNLSAVRRTGALSSISDIRGLPVIDQGVVFAASFSGRMVALDQVSGERLWQRELGTAETPWVAGDAVFVVTSEQQVAALSRQTGGVYWVTPLPRFEAGSRDKPVVWMGPVLAGSRLIVAGNNGQMVEVAPGTGKVIRTQKLDGAVAVPPVIAGGYLLVLTEKGRLVAYR